MRGTEPRLTLFVLGSRFRVLGFRGLAFKVGDLGFRGFGCVGSGRRASGLGNQGLGFSVLCLFLFLTDGRLRCA